MAHSPVESYALPSSPQPRSWTAILRQEAPWVGALTLAALAILLRYGHDFGYWQYVVLASWYAGLLTAGIAWRPLQWATIAAVLPALLAVWLYSDGQTPADNLLLRYVLQGVAAVYWMSLALLAATATYLAYVVTARETLGRLASALTWVGVVFGFIGLGVRWRETYLGHPDWGHIPVSNLWEVMVLFCASTALFWLYYEQRNRARALGAFVMPLVAMGVGFLLWLTLAQHMDRIEPLIPALQSFWMKLHVPMMFVGYANFTIASLVGLAYLLTQRSQRRGGSLARVLPSLEVQDEVMYKAIALGFLFFTVATILGAVWAARAWGGFWSWDPKETWALIVWLNYAGYLHARVVKGWHGRSMAWWSFMSLWVVSFCFLGVNLFLSGLHSYGKL
ncbi:c-type cytochrome biogenesis protein CcsB [Acidithiobacillus caldus]|jgi:cytochrome c-type biogenesis protein CcsB|uniref:Cytochrome c-type biogenesis protein CcsA/ResC n=3 Tax=Acidithiobacillus caldus TaxID=33059 RepID=F9ZTK2_ACICS|nr:c-type cytochrome biogenesis protein CcsB [Acidithiobacillus caldus]AEK59363.1 Cytochrome c-type biogenesis protein CcsA/ResC [Acidithiobacillus caldus SM-1]AIA56408.1 Cytochrome c-type biogenesis protein CcsA/ResC [Acidithiobacillus caldus ATCC 51756]AUW33741.1 c-type cytochrome biogenesis protein CcsB [Acidithiobacillus caldus]MBU2730557.1 c-type cytochrome biogenesis protein CcsB [Acidithiobacillus caldus]MBU2734988.1 c-type cytochrome biogenesis protein CcsB [Acidithiobacillus caldus AT